MEKPIEIIYYKEVVDNYVYDVEKDTWSKPMAQQKLYTEEQVRKVWKAGQKYWETSGASITLEELLETLTHIELPSDEDINKKAYNWCQVEHDEDGCIRAGDDYDIREMPAFIAGAKWMKEQILK